MAIADDFSVALNGDIRYTGTTTNYTVIAFHRYLGGLMDDAAAAGDDLLDITNATASARSTDNIITLNEPYNIDWVVSQHLYDGSVTQNGGDDRWDGILVYAAAGMPLQLIQNEVPISPNFWDTGINADASAGISHRFMVKVRTGGADIDNRVILGQTRVNEYTYSAFLANGGQTVPGNNVLALTYADDLNNNTAIATIEGWTTIDNTTEGYNAIDVNNDTTDEYYYSEWNRAALTINQFTERHKWLTRESTILDSSADTGSDFQVGNATITGQAQSFAVGSNDEYLTRVRVKMKKTGSPTGNLTAVLYTHTGSFGTTSTPTGAALATSATFDVADLTTAYKEYELDFSGDLYLMLNSATYYCISFEHAVIDGSNYISIEGLASSGTHGGNRAQEVGTWSAAATDDLDFEVFSSPDVYGLAGEVFRGITHEVALSTGSGTWATPEHERLTWSGGTGQLLAVDNKTGASATAMWIQLLTGAAPTNTQVITGDDSGATGTASGTAGTRTVSVPPFGASTGTAIIGAYGLGVEYNDLVSADKVTALDELVYSTPDNQTWTLGGLVFSPDADRIMVTPRGYMYQYDNDDGAFNLGETLTYTSPAGTAYLSNIVDDGTTGWHIVRMLTGDPPEDDGTITGGGSSTTADVNGDAVPYQDVRYMKLATTLNSDPETDVVCVDNIPTWLPGSGSIRIQMNTGLYRLIAYSSYITKTFTISGTENFSADPATGGAAEAGNSIYPTPLDQDASAASHNFVGTYTSDVDLFFRVRDGGATPIKTNEGIATFGAGGGSATATRISDA